MNTMHLADDQARMITVNLGGSTITQADKAAFNEAVSKIGDEENVKAEAVGQTPRADELAEKIAAAVRLVLTERGHTDATVTVRMFNPDEEAGYAAMADEIQRGRDEKPAPDQARIGVEFVNGNERAEALDGLAAMLSDLFGDDVMGPLPEQSAIAGRLLVDKLLTEIIRPGLALFANEEWLAKANAASPRGVQASALSLMATVLEHDYAMEVLHMQHRATTASGLLRGRLLEAGKACSNADTGLHGLVSYLNDGGEPEIVPWKDGSPVDTVNAAFSFGILQGIETVGRFGGQYKGLHETAVTTGQTDRFPYYALAALKDAPFTGRGLDNVRAIITQATEQMDAIRDEAKRAEAMAERALAEGVAPGDARVQ